MGFNEWIVLLVAVEGLLWALLAGLGVGSRTNRSGCVPILFRALVELAFIVTVIVALVGWIARAATE